jgi:4-amino-4-deoxy-L-arabinose transferase-like glycosyltransferase
MSVRRWLVLIVLATVLGRVLFLVLFSHTLSLQTSGYDTYAVHLMEGKGYTRFDDRSGDSDLPPLYPYFLVGVYSFFGRDPIPVAVVQIGMDVLTVLLLYRIGRRIAGEAVGLWTAAFYGMYPYLLFQNLTLNDTGMFILLLTGGIWLAYLAHDTRDWRAAAALGILFGLGALTKTLVLLVLPLLALWWWRQLGLRHAVRLTLISTVMLALVIAPWVIRNTRLHGQFVLISTNDGSNLYQGNNPCVVDYLSRGWDAQWVNCLQPPPEGLSEVELSRWSRQQALHYLRDHVGEWPRLFGTKFWVLWSPVIMPYDLPPDPYLVDDTVFQYHTATFRAARIIHVLYFGPLLALGAIGMVLAWKNKLLIGPLVAVLVAITVTYLVFHPSTRYRSPADPFVFVLSAYALVRLYSNLKEKIVSRST